VRVTQMSARVACRTFENDRVRTHFAAWLARIWPPPMEGGGFWLVCISWLLEAYGFGVPVGGSGSLTSALISCIEGHGGRVLANVDVEVVQSRSGRVTGGRTGTDGILAKEAVIAAIHPHHLGRLVQGIDQGVAADAASTEISSNACITLHAAFERAAAYPGGEPLCSVMLELLPPRYEVLRPLIRRSALRPDFSNYR